MPEKPWKRAQRVTAILVRGKRIISGEGSAPDVISDTLALEVRLRKDLPRWILEGVDRARRLAPRHRLGGLIMVDRETGERYLVLDLKDYLDWHGGKEATSE